MAGDPEWWKGAVLYQVYPRSFLDSDGDGIGDLAGIARRLDHVAALGADGVWLSPVFRSPMADFGYDVSDYRDVDPMFGTLADFDLLLERAHGLGLRVVVDLVLAHTSDRHPWFAESRRGRTGPKADWYVWADPKPDGTPPNNWLSVFGGPAWTFDPVRGQYYLHDFLSSQPDLNLRCPEVEEAVLDVARFWLGRGVDGFRLDVANHWLHDPRLRDNPPRPAGAEPPAGQPRANPYAMQLHVHDKSHPDALPLLGRFRAVLDAHPGAFAVAEVFDDDPIGRAAEYVAGTDRLHTAYSFELLTERGGAGVIRAAVEGFLGRPGGGWPSWAFSNHDVVRVATRWGGPDAPPALAKTLIVLLCCLRGTAFLYQGEELGLPEAEVPPGRLQDPYGRRFWPVFKGRDGCRTPMPWRHDLPHGGFTGAAEPWLPVPAAHLARAVDLQEADPDSVLLAARAFLAWRRTRPALRRGEIAFLDAPEPVLAFERRLGDERLVCAFNLGPGETRAALPATAPAGAPGLSGRLEGGVVVLPGHGAWIGA